MDNGINNLDKKPIKWYYSKPFIIFMIIFLFPIGVLLIMLRLYKTKSLTDKQKKLMKIGILAFIMLTIASNYLLITSENKDFYDNVEDTTALEEKTKNEDNKENIQVVENEVSNTENIKTTQSDTVSEKDTDIEENNTDSGLDKSENNDIQIKGIPGEIYSIEEYPYMYPKSEKIIELYKEFQNNCKFNTDEEICLKSEKQWFSSKIQYIETLDRYGVLYYYGEMKDSKPHGMGVIYSYHSKDEFGENAFPMIEYIGEFSKGYLDGYGIRYIFDYLDNSISTRAYMVKYEGEWKEGSYNGYGCEYRTNLSMVANEETLDAILSSVEDYSYDNEDYGENGGVLYVSKFNEGKWNDGQLDGDIKIYNLDDILMAEIEYDNGEEDGDFVAYNTDGNIIFFGKMKNGELIKGKEYYQSGQIKYDGEYKNSVYEGKGTLYNEDGTIKYKGEFKNGDIKG